MAQTTGTTVRALRYYEEIGLFVPSRSPGNARVYGPEVRRTVEAIVAFRSLGLAIDDIRSLLDAQTANTAAKNRLAQALEKRLQTVQSQSTQIEAAIATLRHAGVSVDRA